MTAEDKKSKILSAIQSRGWFNGEIYLNEANELRAAGLIKLATKRSAVGAMKSVWVAA